MSAKQALLCQIFFLIILNLFVYPVLADYYSTDSTFSPHSQNRSEDLCNSKGKHLASIQTKSENENANALCEEVDDNCWIGLQIKFNQYKNSTIMRWIDGSHINMPFINQSLCEDYEQIINYNENGITYYSYINTIDNCWNLTANNSSIQMCAVCGPVMFDPTGWYWICYGYIPVILAAIFSIYYIYSFIYLLYHLCIFEHNYPDRNLEATITIKITALLIPGIPLIVSTLFFPYCIITFIGYKTTKLFPPDSYYHIPEYPYIFTQAGYIGIAGLVVYFIYVPLSYSHVLLRLMHVFNHNPIMKGAIPFKRCYSIIIILIMLYFVLPGIYLIVNDNMPSAYNNSWKLAILLSVLGCWLMIDITINAILLYLYVKGLHRFSKQHYFRRDEAEKYANYKVINQRQHELMLEATRYTVLFLIVLIFNILVVCSIFAVYGYSQYYISQRKFPWAPVAADYIRDAILIVFFCIKEVLLAIAVQLSFIFSHRKYERLCGKCDRKIKIYCQDIVVKENEKIVKEYKVKQLQKPLLMEKISDKVELETVVIFDINK